MEDLMLSPSLSPSLLSFLSAGNETQTPTGSCSLRSHTKACDWELGSFTAPTRGRFALGRRCGCSAFHTPHDYIYLPGELTVSMLSYVWVQLLLLPVSVQVPYSLALEELGRQSFDYKNNLSCPFPIIMLSQMVSFPSDFPYLVFGCQFVHIRWR